MTGALLPGRLECVSAHGCVGSGAKTCLGDSDVHVYACTREQLPMSRAAAVAVCLLLRGCSSSWPCVRPESSSVDLSSRIHFGDQAGISVSFTLISVNISLSAALYNPASRYSPYN